MLASIHSATDVELKINNLASLQYIYIITSIFRIVLRIHDSISFFYLYTNVVVNSFSRELPSPIDLYKSVCHLLLISSFCRWTGSLDETVGEMMEELHSLSTKDPFKAIGAPASHDGFSIHQ
jgi:hypothetical protein